MNPVALVTGSSRGIGRAIATTLAGLGYDLVVNYVSRATAADEAIADCAGAAQRQGKVTRAVACQADVGQTADREKLLQLTRATFGRLDLLVNNAGVAPQVRADLLETSEESFDRLMRINVKGPFFLAQAAARWMIELADRGQYQGLPDPKIITISSISAYTASIHRGEYCMAKAALSMLTPLFATRLADHGVRVYEIRPGIIATDMTHAVKAKYDQLIADGLTPIRRWGTPEDVAQAVAAIAQDLLRFSTGEVLNVDGGFHIRRL